jgi:hypothetical protein
MLVHANVARLTRRFSAARSAKPPLIFRSTGVFKFGGKGEIRTHGTPKRTLDFESSAFDHSATFPFTATALLLLRPSPSGSVLSEKKIIDDSKPFSKPLFVSLLQHTCSIRLRYFQSFNAAHIRAQYCRHRYRSIRILEILQHRDERAPDSQSGPI